VIDIETDSIDLENKNKVALKLLGGGIPNVPFQMGVVKALEEWGFTVCSGCLGEDEDRQFGPRTLNPIIGSSSGSFAAIALAMGYDYDDLMGISGRIEPITESIIRDPIETGLTGLLT
jgi:predicted acylesterase/phospholipase RssA